MVGRFWNKIKILIIAAVLAIIDTILPFGGFIVNGIKKVLGFGYHLFEGTFFNVAKDVFFYLTGQLFGISTPDQFLSIWDEWIVRIKPWDAIFPIHEIIILLLLVGAYVICNYLNIY